MVSRYHAYRARLGPEDVVKEKEVEEDPLGAYQHRAHSQTGLLDLGQKHEMGFTEGEIELYRP